MFGEDIVGEDGEVDRKLLGPKVFSDKVIMCSHSHFTLECNGGRERSLKANTIFCIDNGTGLYLIHWMVIVHENIILYVIGFLNLQKT